MLALEMQFSRLERPRSLLPWQWAVLLLLALGGAARLGPGLLEGREAAFVSSAAIEQHASDTAAQSRSGAGSLPAPVAEGGGKTALAAPPLSRSLAHSYSQNGTLIVALASFHFLDFTLNWVHHLQLLNISNYLIGATDAETGQVLAERGIHVFTYCNHSTGTGDLGWGSAGFHRLVTQKIGIAHTFVSFDLDLCFSDVDTVWLQDPIPFFNRYPEADILSSSDELEASNTPGDDGLEQPDRALHGGLNTGFLFFRHRRREEALQFIEEWQHAMEQENSTWEQSEFNRVALAGVFPLQPLPEEPRLVWAANRTVAFGVLPVAQFASGHTFFVQRLYELQNVQPIMAHCTFQYGGAAGKRHRLREAMLWVDPPDYYTEGLFLSVDLQYPNAPASFQEKGPEEGQSITSWKSAAIADFHRQAVGQQLRQLKTAFQLAVALNRTLIMPKLLAWCDRYWAPLDHCRIPGAPKTGLPFVAPMDHMLEPANFAAGKNDGPVIRYREHSFLLNERTPSSLKEARLTVEVATTSEESELARHEQHEVIVIPEGLSDRELRAALEPHRSAQMLHFGRLDGAFGWFEDPADEEAFEWRLRHMMGIHCCKEEDTKAFDYYDLMSN